MNPEVKVTKQGPQTKKSTEKTMTESLETKLRNLANDIVRLQTTINSKKQNLPTHSDLVDIFLLEHDVSDLHCEFNNLRRGVNKE